jgi:hypothetical protein
MRVTTVANNSPNPVSAQYTSTGGTLLVQFAGSAWSSNGGEMISASLLMDNAQIATASVYANPSGTHMALVPVAVLLNGVNAGTHTFTVSSKNQMDGNDLFTITVYEYFLG